MPPVACEALLQRADLWHVQILAAPAAEVTPAFPCDPGIPLAAWEVVVDELFDSIERRLAAR